jgi:hypothetical protein
MAVLVLARVKGTRAIYGVLLETVSSPGTICGVVGPLADAASRRRFLAGELPTDPNRAAWGQRQRWAFPSLALRLAPDLTPAAGATTTAPLALPQTASYRPEYVRCGKAACTRCRTGAGHGPYWYAYWRQDGRLHKRYLGKTPPQPGI